MEILQALLYLMFGSVSMAIIGLIRRQERLVYLSVVVAIISTCILLLVAFTVR